MTREDYLGSFRHGFFAGVKVVSRYGRANSGLRLHDEWKASAATDADAFTDGYNYAIEVTDTHDSLAQTEAKLVDTITSRLKWNEA